MSFPMNRTLIAIVIVGMLGAATSSAAVAQGDTSEGFPLPASAAYCEPGYLGPFIGCTPWSGVTVTYTSSDGTFDEACSTQPADRSATCSMYVPFGAIISASIDPSAIPTGYVLEGEASQTFEIPDGPPQGLFGGPSFVLVPDDGDDDAGAVVAALIAILLEIMA